MEIAAQFQLNDYVAKIITSIILFFILGSEFLIQYRVKFHRRKKEGAV